MQINFALCKKSLRLLNNKKPPYDFFRVVFIDERITLKLCYMNLLNKTCANSEVDCGF